MHGPLGRELFYDSIGREHPNATHNVVWDGCWRGAVHNLGDDKVPDIKGPFHLTAPSVPNFRKNLDGCGTIGKSQLIILLFVLQLQIGIRVLEFLNIALELLDFF
jgi:hypothetical protein